MTAQDYATVAVAVCTIIGGFTAAVRWLVKHYLTELKPNSGSSMNDRLTRVESKLEVIYDLITKDKI
jgi:hypothetical protein